MVIEMADDSQRQGEVGVLVHNVPLRSLLFVFMKISAQAWGGGSSTVYMMNHELVQRGWITQAQFALDFGLARLVPGINLLAMAVMTGYRLNGWIGSIVASIGLMVPASVITVGLTVGFTEFTSNAIGNSVVRGVVPVTAALTYAFALQSAREVIPWRERRVMLLMLLYMCVCFVLVTAFQVSVAWLIIAGGVCGGIFFRPSDRKRSSRA